MNDLSQRTLDKICAHVAADLPCLRSPMCDLEWMRPSASSSRSLLSTTVSVEKATVCKVSDNDHHHYHPTTNIKQQQLIMSLLNVLGGSPPHAQRIQRTTNLHIVHIVHDVV